METKITCYECGAEVSECHQNLEGEWYCCECDIGRAMLASTDLTADDKSWCEICLAPSMICHTDGCDAPTRMCDGCVYITEAVNGTMCRDCGSAMNIKPAK